MKKLVDWLKNPITLSLGILIIVIFGMADSCGGPANAGGNPAAQQAGIEKAANAQVYIPKNNIELNNYNNRQKIADDPTTILWCTTSWGNPSSPLFTVPIVGKLTSGAKRPYSTSQAQNSGSSTDVTYSPELPGPDGMYGPSDSYRYGFTPAGTYVEFSGAMNTYCTTEPTVWQRESTTIVMDIDPKLAQAQIEAQAALKAGDPAKAQAILSGASK